MHRIRRPMTGLLLTENIHHRARIQYVANSALASCAVHVMRCAAGSMFNSERIRGPVQECSDIFVQATYDLLCFGTINCASFILPFPV